MVETEFEVKIKFLRSDNGAEFQMKEFFKNKGNIHQKSCVETLQQNGIVERKHQHLLNVARTLRFQLGLSLDYWNDCVLTATYIISRVPTSLLNNKNTL